MLRPRLALTLALTLVMAAPHLLAAAPGLANALQDATPDEQREAAAQERTKPGWTSVDAAALRGRASAEAALLARLGRGEPVRALRERGAWVFVQAADGREGWLFRGHLAQSPPAPAPASLFDPLPGSMILAEAADTARSARSLGPPGPPAPQACAALAAALDVRLSPDMLDDFLRNASLGEHAALALPPPPDAEPPLLRAAPYGGEAERQLGLNLAARALRRHAHAAFGQSLARYVNLVALAVGRHAPGVLPGARVVLLELPEPVSFSLPGGLVLLSTGAVAALDNEAQLALLLAHELAHAALGHLWAEALSEPALVQDGALDRAGPARPQFSGMLDRLEETALARGLDAMLEQEADRAAVDMAWRAGYDPREYPALLHRMEDAGRARPSEESPRDWAALHPPTAERLARLASLLEQAPLEGLVLAGERFQASR